MVSERVFPLVRQRIPEARIALVGPNPVQQLRAHASDHVEVPGFATDLNLEIARSALYIAPLITGSGFKNKIAEALANGTYVIGTSMAAEFLEPAIRAQLIVVDELRTDGRRHCGISRSRDTKNELSGCVRRSESGSRGGSGPPNWQRWQLLSYKGNGRTDLRKPRISGLSLQRGTFVPGRERIALKDPCFVFETKFARPPHQSETAT